MPRKLLAIGAAGSVGSELVTLLSRNGETVRAAARQPKAGRPGLKQHYRYRYTQTMKRGGGLLIKTVVAAIGAGLVVGSIEVRALTAPTRVGVLQRSKRRAQPRRKTSRAHGMIAQAQQRLSDLGYWIPSVDGKWREGSRQALIAFQKVEGRARTGRLNERELAALRSAQTPIARERGFPHVEVELKRQVLFIVGAGGIVSKILPVSTGNGEPFTIEGETEPAITPTGRFRVYRKLPGWRESPLGLLYYPSYILGGIAIHGNPAVPSRPASHGCIRIPMFAAKEFSDMTPIGTQVIIYDGGSTPPH